MKQTVFNYTKKDGSKRDVDVMIMVDSETYVSGIDFTLLTKEEQKEVAHIQMDYEEKLKPYMKAYRKFLREGMEV